MRYTPAMRDHLYYVYMLASQRNGTLYIGVSNNIIRRTWEHKHDLIDGFTKKYGVHTLVGTNGIRTSTPRSFARSA